MHSKYQMLRDATKVQILITVFKVSKSLKTWHSKPTSKNRCRQKQTVLSPCVATSGPKSWSKTTANVQLECMLCACVRWNTSRWQQSRGSQSKCYFVYGLYICPSFGFSFWMTSVDYCRGSYVLIYLFIFNEYEIHSNIIHLHQGYGFDSQ